MNKFKKRPIFGEKGDKMLKKKKDIYKPTNDIYNIYNNQQIFVKDCLGKTKYSYGESELEELLKNTIGEVHYEPLSKKCR